MNIIEWIIDNIAWELLVAFLVMVTIFFKSLRTTKRILTKNRETLGNGYGDHLADRFIRIWKSKSPIKYKEIRHICIATGKSQISTTREEKDDELIKLGLIRIEELNNQKLVFPVLNWQNRFIAKIVEFYLINFIGDNKKYYKDLRQ
jgi:hypothetical protein